MLIFLYRIISSRQYLSRCHILPNVLVIFFQSLELEDLDWMLHGSEDTVSVEDWKAHTEYNGYKETDPHIYWFCEIVGRMTAEQRKVLLFFWTSVKYLPVEGFGGLALHLYIYRLGEPDYRLPSSHTCFYRLCLPAYSFMAVMQDSLGVITQEHTLAAVLVRGELIHLQFGFKIWF